MALVEDMANYSFGEQRRQELTFCEKVAAVFCCLPLPGRPPQQTGGHRGSPNSVRMQSARMSLLESPNQRNPYQAPTMPMHPCASADFHERDVSEEYTNSETNSSQTEPSPSENDCASLLPATSQRSDRPSDCRPTKGEASARVRHSIAATASGCMASRRPYHQRTGSEPFINRPHILPKHRRSHSGGLPGSKKCLLAREVLGLHQTASDPDEEAPAATLGVPATLSRSDSASKLSAPQLGKWKDGAYEDDAEEDCCPTCLEDYTDDNPRILTDCNHHFHLGCIYEWMERSNKCPVCSKEMHFAESV
mmetsp:Transcript_14662/g.31434  ORF Transcript_14662/g.31434 Transcript_14662/m.31434 type:complete len:307 (-) Transcript_14662:191-1111(-)|eukprot:CAMPEP_0118956734 /NCGR_PEP_ID=MMETSP1169-20130426/61736_1 /TAXON_ID=36882 /ORGANISM="Pyramimonas obovata, Strain CCMP722" /LENGTH=306 /DNA_ID=CAMNT_0006904781 /DNA_START=487 /DNA_END=1407 /DNA_ORIENTATION=-